MTKHEISRWEDEGGALSPERKPYQDKPDYRQWTQADVADAIADGALPFADTKSVMKAVEAKGAKDGDNAHAERLGEALAAFFRTRRDVEHVDRYLTSWGTKTKIGIWRSVLRIIEETK